MTINVDREHTLRRITLNVSVTFLALMDRLVSCTFVSGSMAAFEGHTTSI